VRRCNGDTGTDRIDAVIAKRETRHQAARLLFCAAPMADRA